jgi:hypothetical protein
MFDYGIVGTGIEHLELGTSFVGNGDAAAASGAESHYVRRVLCTSCGRDFDLSIVNVRGENGYVPIGCGRAHDADMPTPEMIGIGESLSSALPVAAGHRSHTADRHQMCVSGSGGVVDSLSTAAAPRHCHQHHHHHHQMSLRSPRPLASLPMSDSTKMAAASAAEIDRSFFAASNNGADLVRGPGADIGSALTADVTSQPVGGSDISSAIYGRKLGRTTPPPLLTMTTSDESSANPDCWRETTTVRKQLTTTTKTKDNQDGMTSSSITSTTIASGDDRRRFQKSV